MYVVIEVTLGLIIGILWEFFIILFVLIIILIIVVARKSFVSKEKLPSVPVDGVEWLSGDKSESLKEYEDEYLARQGIESTSRKPTARRKPAETRESESNFCDNCGKSLRPTAKFCGSCGTSVP